MIEDQSQDDEGLEKTKIFNAIVDLELTLLLFILAITLSIFRFIS